MEETPLKFIRVPIQRGLRVLIESTCSRCLAHKVVSRVNGTLEKWEAGHVCAKPEKKKAKARVIPIRRR